VDADGELHSWHIEPREYARDEARGGKRHGRLVITAAYERSPVEREFWGAEVAELYRHAGAGGVGPGLTVHEADPLVEKTAFSAFFPGKCPLPDLLTERGIDSVLITGTLTNVCCEASARDASAAGFRMIMVADANAARRDQDHNATLHNIYRAFGDVRPAAEVLSLWQAMEP
jgi:nicotinamidase-related amidase